MFRRLHSPILFGATSLVLLLGIGLWSSSPAKAAPTKAAPTTLPAGGIEVTLRPRSAKGRIGCLLFSSARGFPGDKKFAKQALRVRVTRDKSGHYAARCRFVGVKPGSYAIAVLHDENNNDKMDKSFFGSPKEGYGVSNDAKPGTFSGPTYRAAQFRYDGKPRRLAIRLRY